VPVKVKICGVRTPAIVETAAEEGADFVGFVLFPKSPRYIEPEEARVLAAIAKGKVGTVAVLVDPDDALIDEVVERVRPNLLQLHGDETPERVAAIKGRAGLPVMKAIAVAEAGDVADAGKYAASADFILFDAKASPDALLGGLTPDTVGEAIRLTGASLVDVSSGVERAPGEKDAQLVRRFIRAAKGASPQSRAKAS
jgi:phosphoribosylanthranilate isomerase